MRLSRFVPPGRLYRAKPRETSEDNAQLTSFLARTADGTPKTFALQDDPSRTTHPPSSKRSPYIVFPGRPSRHMELSSTFKRIFSPNGNIEKVPAPLS
ncbi:hypothetical protein AVEN_178987-1 [Araneus ventricosus]|uniref:Uncharacterized protein n=1 Tax=Araneus ventricosus TaxID=182803 RepID=A0A4Y2MTG7_ARAVE|nr:hypothetical protein AVEN_178987-1 [Araneus ventricosus]